MDGQEMGFAMACCLEKFEFLCPMAKLAKKPYPGTSDSLRTFLAGNAKLNLQVHSN
jgi:hypothetical protein